MPAARRASNPGRVGERPLGRTPPARPRGFCAFATGMIDVPNLMRLSLLHCALRQRSKWRSRVRIERFGCFRDRPLISVICDRFASS